MTRTIESTVYKFSELSESAKERARSWYRQGIETEQYADSVIDDAATIADKLGIDLRTRPVKLMGGGTRYDPCVWWSGFSSQGDGACFEGTYSYRKGSVAAIRDYAPQDAELHQIAETLQAVQASNFYALSAIISHRGHYSHSFSMDISIERTDDRTLTADAEETVTQALRDFADWIYRALKREYDYQNSDEQVDESIDANEYEFDEEGNRA